MVSLSPHSGARSKRALINLPLSRDSVARTYDPSSISFRQRLSAQSSAQLVLFGMRRLRFERAQDLGMHPNDSAAARMTLSIS